MLEPDFLDCSVLECPRSAHVLDLQVYRAVATLAQDFLMDPSLLDISRPPGGSLRMDGVLSLSFICEPDIQPRVLHNLREAGREIHGWLPGLEMSLSEGEIDGPLTEYDNLYALFGR